MLSATKERPQVLVVGAGSIGQVFGNHLANAGAAVSFFVKEKHAVAVRHGFRLYRIPAFRLSKKGELRTPTRFDSFSVITTLAEVAKGRWDAVYLAVSSPALRSGWFPEFARALPEPATLVVLQDGLEDLEYVRQYVPAERVVHGGLGFSSYAAPLPGETVSDGPGTAYWLPGGPAASFSGSADRTAAVVALLRQGGFVARRVDDVRAASAVGTAIGGIIVAALPLSGWSFAGLSRDRALLAMTSAAARQAVSVVERTVQIRAGAARFFARPLCLRLALRIAPRLAPFLIEPFFRFHFTKVNEQIVAALATYVRLAHTHGLPADALSDLLARRQTES